MANDCQKSGKSVGSDFLLGVIKDAPKLVTNDGTALGRC